METKSLNCSVFFNPSNGKRKEKMPSDSLKLEKRMHTRPGENSIRGKLFTITYVPEKAQKKSEKPAAHLSKNASSWKKAKPLSRSCVEIKECFSPNRKSENHLKMNYVIDEQVKCRTCWELKNALDYTFQKLYDVSQMRVAEKERKEKERGKVLSKDGKKKSRAKKHCRTAQSNSESSSKHVLNEVEDTGPLMEFFSRLVRSATIKKMRKFSRTLEEKLCQKEMATFKSKESIKDTFGPKRIDENGKASLHQENECESCDRLRQAMYVTVSKLYEEAGVKTDFPTVQKLETYAFLVYPNGVQYPATCQKVNETKKKRPAGCRKQIDSSKDLPRKPLKTTGKRKSEEMDEEENRKQLRSRIKRHKAAFTVFMDWMKREQPYGSRVVAVIIVLFFGCIYNLYLMIFHRTFSFKNYFIIPICWVILSLSNGKCADPLMPNHICNTKIHFMSHVYLFIVFLEYYLASGIHAVLVLEINQFHRIPLKELLKYSVFNLPLMIIVLVYAIFKLFSELGKRVKTYFSKPEPNINV